MPYVNMNGNVYDVPLGVLERKIIRVALNRHADELEKAIKKDNDLGVANATAVVHLAAIRGDEGWGASLLGKLDEQRTLDEAASDDTEQGKARALARECEALARVLEPLGAGIDPKALAEWTPEQRAAVREWAELWTRRGRDDADPTVLVPATPDVLLDVLREIALAERELEAGAFGALHNLLQDIGRVVPVEALRDRTEQERQQAADFALELLGARRAYEAASAGSETEYQEAEQALAEVEEREPEWLLEFDHRERTETGTAEAGDDWTAAPGELRQDGVGDVAPITAGAEA